MPCHTSPREAYYLNMGLILVRFTVLLSLLAGTAGAQKLSGFDPGALDRTADPCVNFYQYACGGWLASNPVPGDQASWGRFDALQERNRTMLQSILGSSHRLEQARRRTDRSNKKSAIITLPAWTRRPSIKKG